MVRTTPVTPDRARTLWRAAAIVALGCVVVAWAAAAFFVWVGIAGFGIVVVALIDLDALAPHDIALFVIVTIGTLLISPIVLAYLTACVIRWRPPGWRATGLTFGLGLGLFGVLAGSALCTAFR